MKLSNMSNPNASSSAVIQQTEVLMKDKKKFAQNSQAGFFHFQIQISTALISRSTPVQLRLYLNMCKLTDSSKLASITRIKVIQTS